MNIDTNRSFGHKDGPLIGFIWVHLLSGGWGTHPSDPSLFTHPPRHGHVLLRHPPTLRAQPRLVTAEIIMTTATMAALETTESVGHRDSLSTSAPAGWRKTQTTLRGFVLGAPTSFSQKITFAKCHIIFFLTTHSTTVYRMSQDNMCSTRFIKVLSKLQINYHQSVLTNF